MKTGLSHLSRGISLNDHINSLRAGAAGSPYVSALFFQGDAAHRDKVGLEDPDDDAECDDELPPDDGARVVGANVLQKVEGDLVVDAVGVLGPLAHTGE